jgi:hypothetical protein
LGGWLDETAKTKKKNFFPNPAVSAIKISSGFLKSF